MTDVDYFPKGKGWEQVYEYTHNYLAARYGKSQDVEDAASDGFMFTFDKWAKAPSTKLGEWDKSMAFAFAVRISCMKARKALGKYLYGETISLQQVLNDNDDVEDRNRYLADIPEVDNIVAEEENALAGKMITWCLENPRQRRWMEEFLSGESGAAIARKTVGDTTQKAFYRKKTGLGNVSTVFRSEIEALR